MPQLLPTLQPMFEKAFEGREEVISWEIGMAFFPNADSEIVGLIGLFIELQGAALGTVICGTTMLAPNGHTQETVSLAVDQAIQQLENYRSTQLQKMVDQQTDALKNGRPAPLGGGLILP